MQRETYSRDCRKGKETDNEHQIQGKVTGIRALVFRGVCALRMCCTEGNRQD